VDDASRRISEIEAWRESLERRFGDVQANVALILQAVQEADESGSRSVPGSARNSPLRDSLWCCPKCSARLGIYDEDAKCIRIRHRDSFIYAHRGDVSVVCRGCGEICRLDYQLDDDDLPWLLERATEEALVDVLRRKRSGGRS